MNLPIVCRSFEGDSVFSLTWREVGARYLKKVIGSAERSLPSLRIRLFISPRFQISYFIFSTIEIKPTVYFSISIKRK